MNKKRPLEFYENYRGCWICCNHKAKSYNGYSLIKHNGKIIRLHRYMYEKHVGRIPKGMCVLHKCDNPSCNNPAHLFLGTRLDNAKDRDNKGRQADRRGIKNGLAVLTERQVREIYFAKGTQTAIAKAYGISQGAIGFIKRRITWKHLNLGHPL